MTHIQSERPQDGPQIEQLLDIAFGPDRWARPSYRLRQGVTPIHALCFTARVGGRLAGAIRFWPVSIGGVTDAVLLGPIAVHPSHEGCGIGSRLIRKGLGSAAQDGDRIVVAIGDPRYLGRFGFRRARDSGLSFPFAIEDERFLALELVPGALDGVSGEIERKLPPAAASLP